MPGAPSFVRPLHKGWDTTNLNRPHFRKPPKLSAWDTTTLNRNKQNHAVSDPVKRLQTPIPEPRSSPG